MKSFKLHFTGYYLYDYLLKQYKDLYRNNADYAAMKIPGIYCVYTGEIVERDNLKINELIYIGKAENIYHRLATHNKIDKFINCSSGKERLLISFAAVNRADDRDRVESAMIFKHHPPCNVANAYNFNYPPTELLLSGETELLNTHFIVRKEQIKPIE